METGLKHVEEAVVTAVAAVLAEADADIASRQPVCRASGRCCQFEKFGHRLYVTTAELLHFVHVQGVGKGIPLPLLTQNAEGCPYQVEGLCTARAARPLGCRVYFCDANAQAWQNEVYEKYHAKLKAVHDALGVPYQYTEWRAALREYVTR
jgi:hypothetical protein